MGFRARSGMTRFLVALVFWAGTVPSLADARTGWQATPLQFDDAHLPVVEVTLHSRKRPDEARTFRFMLDTGAARCVLDASVPDAFFWNDLNPTTRLHDGSGQWSDVPSVLIKRLVVGGMVRDMLPAVRIDLKRSLLGRFQDHPIDGILGMPFLRGTRFVFNPVKNLIEWWNAPVGGVDIPVEYREDGRPFIHIRVGKTDVPCTLDTGGATGFQLPMSCKPDVEGIAGLTGGVLSGESSGITTCRVERIEAAGQVWRGVDADFQKEGEALIGQGVWSAAPACFDFIQNAVVLSLREDGSLPIQSSTQLPIAWDRSTTPAQLVVLAVRPGTPLERAGLKPGDRVLRVDGIGGEALQRRSLIESLGKQGSHSWTIRRGDREITLEIH